MCILFTVKFVLFTEMLDTYLVAMQDAEQFLGFLHSLSDMGAAMRRVMAEALTNKDIYKTLTTGQFLLVDNSTRSICSKCR